MCDGENDCADGSDEESCDSIRNEAQTSTEKNDLTTKSDEYQGTTELSFDLDPIDTVRRFTTNWISMIAWWFLLAGKWLYWFGFPLQHQSNLHSFSLGLWRAERLLRRFRRTRLLSRSFAWKQRSCKLHRKGCSLQFLYEWTLWPKERCQAIQSPESQLFVPCLSKPNELFPFKEKIKAFFIHFWYPLFGS